MKKLVLNRETVRKLTLKDLEGIEGGYQVNKPMSAGKEGGATCPPTGVGCAGC